MPEVKEILRLLRYNSNNINQIAKRLNESKNISASDIAKIEDRQRKVVDLMKNIYFKLCELG